MVSLKLVPLRKTVEGIGRVVTDALLVNVGVGRTLMGGGLEKPLLTVGGCFNQFRQLVLPWGEDYSAANVLEFLLADAIPQH